MPLTWWILTVIVVMPIAAHPNRVATKAVTMFPLTGRFAALSP
jgi:hypothetical protein